LRETKPSPTLRNCVIRGNLYVASLFCAFVRLPGFDSRSL
jgi:hypothetical protein